MEMRRQGDVFLKCGTFLWQGLQGVINRTAIDPRASSTPHLVGCVGFTSIELRITRDQLLQKVPNLGHPNATSRRVSVCLGSRFHLQPGTIR